MLTRREFLAGLTLSCIQMETAFGQQNENQTAPLPTKLWVSRGNEQALLDFKTDIGYRQIAYLLRDIQAQKMGYPDIRLLHTVSWMQTWLAIHGHHVRFDILSGLRTHQTNARTENAALNSLHLPSKQGIFKAMDLRTKEIPSAYLGKLAAQLKQGGVGFYTRDFIHIDTGALIGKSGMQRIWRSK